MLERYLDLPLNEYDSLQAFLVVFTSLNLGSNAAAVGAKNYFTLPAGPLQYSTYYLTNRFTGRPPKDEPLKQFVALVEFNFDTPKGGNTAATMNPGLVYVAVTWQLGGEIIVPLNRDGGNGLGFRVQLLLFPDDLVPSLFGKPLLSDQPERSLIAWH
jgi:hypothetical protein